MTNFKFQQGRTVRFALFSNAHHLTLNVSLKPEAECSINAKFLIFRENLAGSERIRTSGLSVPNIAFRLAELHSAENSGS